MTAYDRAKIRELFAAGDNGASSHAIGKALEDLIEYILVEIPGIDVVARDQNNVFDSEEIDVAVWNDQESGGFKFFDHLILVECKNWSEPVGSQELTVFHSKLRERGLKFGIFVAANGITGDATDLSSAHHRLDSALRDGIQIVVVTRAEIEELGSTEDFVLLMKQKSVQLMVTRSSIDR